MYYASQLFSKPNINSSRKFPKIEPFHLKTQLYDYQMEVVNIALKHYQERGGAFLNVFCSYGKTVVSAFMSALFSQARGLSTLVVYHRDTIGKSWYNTFTKYSDAKIYVVGENTEPPADDVQVFLCMNLRLDNLDIKIRKRIGHFVIDEAHRYCTEGSVKIILSIEPLYVTLLTATYERDDGMHIMLDHVSGPERISRISMKPFFVFKVQTAFEPNPKIGPKGIIFDDLVEQLDNISERNAMIIQHVIDNINRKILILTKHVAHAKQLHSWLVCYLQPYNKTASILAGNIKEYNDAQVIVATYSKAGEGYDDKEACYDWKGERIEMLILASSTRKVEQYAGRVFRTKIPIIIDFVDNHKNCKTHWNLRQQWYQSRNGLIYMATERFCWELIKPHLMEAYQQALDHPNNISTNKPVVQNDMKSRLDIKHVDSLISRFSKIPIS